MKKLRKDAGQMTIESVLIITLLFGAVVFSVSFIQQRRLLAQLVEQPWEYLAGMIENGVWLPPEEGAGLHPHHIARHGSPTGDTP